MINVACTNSNCQPYIKLIHLKQQINVGTNLTGREKERGNHESDYHFATNNSYNEHNYNIYVRLKGN